MGTFQLIQLVIVTRDIERCSEDFSIAKRRDWDLWLNREGQMLGG